MAKVFGKEFSKKDFGRLVGSLSQVAGTKFYELLEGKGRGMRAVDFWTGSGFQFTLLLERAMDISQAFYRGKSLCWRSSTEDVHSHFFEPEGSGWLRGFFGGLLTTCGLTYLGSPCEDKGEKLGLHGRISHTPAEKVKINEEWKGEEYILSAEGQMRQSTVFGENLLLKRKIFTRMGESRLWIYDTVENQGCRKSPLMVLYHINIGFPALWGESRLILPTLEIKPRDEEAAKEKEEYYKFTEPVPNFKEKVYYHKMREDASGIVRCALVNDNLEKEGFGIYINYKKEQLPCFIEWKMMGEGDYVVGIEPANCLVEGRAKERERGTLQFIQPGQVKKFELEIGVLSCEKEIEEFEKLIEKT